MLAHKLVPETFDPVLRSLVEQMVQQVHDQVAVPLFRGATSASRHDAVVWGANIVARFRVQLLRNASPAFWQQALRSMDVMFADLQSKAIELLGAEQGFKLIRGLQMVESTQATLLTMPAQLARPELELAVGLADLMETSARHEAVMLAWMAVLLGDIEVPDTEVAHAAADLFLRLSADQAGRLASFLEGRHAPVVSSIVQDSKRTAEWLGHHPFLALTYLGFLGSAAGTERVRRIEVRVVQDADDESQSWLQLMVMVPADHAEAVEDELEERLRLSGLYACSEDLEGGRIVLLVAEE